MWGKIKINIEKMKIIFGFINEDLVRCREEDESVPVFEPKNKSIYTKDELYILINCEILRFKAYKTY